MTTSLTQQPAMSSGACAPRRFAAVGVGGRASLFLHALAVSHRASAELVAMCDLAPTRLAQYSDKLAGEWQHPPVPTYRPDQFADMIRQTRPEVVVVCTPDHLHPHYCALAMRHGCDVIVEKPLAIDDEGCREIIEAQQATGRRVQVTFNCRYTPWAGLIKQLLMSGVIGQILSADCEWMLDARKGVTYFARWHSQKSKSGGLLVHKSTHHLDLMNWWLDAVPDTVFALGRRGFFGAENKHKHNIGATPAHYADGPNDADPFAPQKRWFGQKEELEHVARELGGYRPDRSVWRDRDLDIEDSAALLIQYRTGVIANYRINAFLPRTGHHVVFNGTRGRIEFHHEPGGRVVPNGEHHTPALPDGAPLAAWRSQCIVHPLFAQAYEVPIPVAEGSHDGSDPLLMDRLFGPPAGPEPLGRDAGAEQGAASALIGAAANLSIASGQPVAIASLCPTLAHATCLHELR